MSNPTKRRRYQLQPEPFSLPGFGSTLPLPHYHQDFSRWIRTEIYSDNPPIGAVIDRPVVGIGWLEFENYRANLQIFQVQMANRLHALRRRILRRRRAIDLLNILRNRIRAGFLGQSTG